MTTEFHSYTSPTLLSMSELDLANPPPAYLICKHCPASMWLVTGGEARSYCSRMHLITWSLDEQTGPSKCDGQVISLAELDARRQEDQ